MLFLSEMYNVFRTNMHYIDMYLVVFCDVSVYYMYCVSKKIKIQHMLHHQELNTTKKNKQMFLYCIHARIGKKVSIRNGSFFKSECGDFRRRGEIIRGFHDYFHEEQ